MGSSRTSSGSPYSTRQPSATSTSITRPATGLSWVEGLEAAKKSGKPILLFQLLGRFDDVHC